MEDVPERQPTTLPAGDVPRGRASRVVENGWANLNNPAMFSYLALDARGPFP